MANRKDKPLKYKLDRKNIAIGIISGVVVLFFTTIAKFFSITTTNFINDVFHISEYTDIIELVFIIILGVLAVFFALGYSSYDAREKQKFSWANTVKYAILSYILGFISFVLGVCINNLSLAFQIASICFLVISILYLFFHSMYFFDSSIEDDCTNIKTKSVQTKTEKLDLEKNQKVQQPQVEDSQPTQEANQEKNVINENISEDNLPQENKKPAETFNVDLNQDNEQKNNLENKTNNNFSQTKG